MKKKSTWLTTDITSIGNSNFDKVVGHLTTSMLQTQDFRVSQVNEPCIRLT